MRISAKVIPGARKNLLKKEGELWVIYLTAPPVDGKANRALVDFLADELDVAKNRIVVTKGLKSRHKTIMIEGL